jgi:aldehyde dehydrogenase (NAD+)
LDGRVHSVYPGAALDYSVSEPFGVVAALTSWNGPLTAIGRKLAPALAAGNCVVLKPSELAPFSTFLAGRLCLEAGLPPGVLGIVPGDAAVGDHLARHAGVDKITMTGSPGTARAIMAAAAQHLTPLALELGGKSANLVFADAGIEKAAAFAATHGATRNAGQGCVLPTRLLVERSVYERVVERVAAALQRVRVGDPLDDATEMGPVISAAACERILAVVHRAVSERHGELRFGGERLDGPLADGYFLSPALFAGVDNRSLLAQQEIFGPVLSAMPFDDEEHALALANDSPYALAGYVHTASVNRAHRIAARLHAGYVSVNGFNPMAPTAPFGGSRDSGFGREGGREGIAEFLRPKNVYVTLEDRP